VLGVATNFHLIIVIRITFDRRKGGREGGDTRKEVRMGGEGKRRGGDEEGMEG
jgi:hypothetical protein